MYTSRVYPNKHIFSLHSMLGIGVVFRKYIYVIGLLDLECMKHCRDDHNDYDDVY